MKRLGLACVLLGAVVLPAAGCSSSSGPSTSDQDGSAEDATFDGAPESSSDDTGSPQDASLQDSTAQDTGSTPADTGPGHVADASTDAASDQTAAPEAASDAAPDQTASPEASVGDAGIEAAAEGGADAGPDGDGGAACIGNVSIDFSALAPYWVDASGTCGTAAASSGSLVLTRNGCTTDPGGGAVTLAPAFTLCGDFDIQVAYDLTAFPYPTAGGRYASVRAYDPANPTNGIAIERFDNDACTSVAVAYKSWTTNSSGCVAPHVATTDTSGKMRLTRTGAAVASYFFTPDDAGGTWTQVMTDTLTTTPWALELYTGYNPPNAGDTQSQTVSFSNVVIASASTP